MDTYRKLEKLRREKMFMFLLLPRPLSISFKSLTIILKTFFVTFSPLM